MKTYIIYQPYYGCNRTRQLQWLLEHGFKTVDAKIDKNGRTVWFFKANQKLVDCLNEFIDTEAVNHTIKYVLSPIL